jgi:hypothetical protein
MADGSNAGPFKEDTVLAVTEANPLQHQYISTCHCLYHPSITHLYMLGWSKEEARVRWDEVPLEAFALPTSAALPHRPLSELE